MRKLAVALLAVPIIAVIYLRFLLGRSVAARVTLVLGVGGLIGLGIVGGLGLEHATADVPSANGPLPQAAFTVDLRVSQDIRQPVTLQFTEPMDEASVLGALRVEPTAAISMTWDATGTALTVTPVDGWVPGTYYTVSVERTAEDRAGHALETPARAAFLTRASYAARLSATDVTDGRIPLDATFVAVIPGDVDPNLFAAAVELTPTVPGHVDVSRIADAVAPTSQPTWEAVFTPDAPLAPDTEYTLQLRPGLLDTEGAPIAVGDPLTVQTAAAPSVVRFRPLDKATKVDRAQTLSVRFTQPMDRTATAAAFSATVGGKAVTGKVSWAEDDTVLVLDPTADFGYGAAVTMTVSAEARSAVGVPIAAPATATFTTVPKPAPKPTPKPTPKPKTTTIPKTGGGTVAAGTWAAVENYYLKLLNCTRTGGWVTTSGSCRTGSNGTKPLWMDAGIQTKMARPYAKVLATTGACSHDAAGTFIQRLQRAGYTGYTRAGENVGCGNGDPYKAMLADHLFFQNEKSTNGGHYLNIMNPIYDRVGVGVWVYGSRVRLVTDFYRP